MHIKNVNITNFRLLEDVNLFFEDRTTVIVGRNNSGKTSLTELFRRILSDNSPTFKLEDFSLGTHDKFWQAYNLWRENNDEPSIRKVLPYIEVKLTVFYGKTMSDVGALSEFIIDLNPDCVETTIVVRYQLENGNLSSLFPEIDLDSEASEGDRKAVFFKTLKTTLLETYKPTLMAVDPNDETNQKLLDWSHIKALLQSGFINAQRGLDDTTHKDNDVLGKILESLFKNAKSNSADPTDRKTALELETAVESIQEDIDAGFNEQLRNLLPAFAIFGYPGLSDPKLRTETTLDVERLLNNHTKVLYSGFNGVHLPEAYNGLGIRNLIFMLLKLLEYFKSYKIRQPAPAVHLVFIEEPEAHLHPQMQEVFISKLSDVSDIFSKIFNDGHPWPVQFGSFAL